MTIVLNGTTGITNDGGYTGDGVVFADTTPANTLVTTTGGNVGIGTSSPTLNTNGTVLHINNSTASRAAIVHMTNAESGSTSADGLICGKWSDGTNYFFDYDSNPIVFGTGGTERARIDSSGNLLVGTTTPVYGTRIESQGGFTSLGHPQFNITSTSSSTAFEWVLRSGTEMQFYVNNSAVVARLTTSGVWTNASDARYKENIRPVTYGLAEVLQLQPRAYNIIGSEKQEIGFVAQEVEPVLPELVESSRNSITEEDRLTLSYGQMSAVLVKAIQEQQAIITALTARVAALEGTQP